MTLWSVVLQVSLSMGFSRREYWSGLPYLPEGDLPDPGIEPMFLMSSDWQVDPLPLMPPGKPYPECSLYQSLGQRNRTSMGRPIIGNNYVLEVSEV